MYELETKLVEILKKKNLTISFAESCTGGLLAATVINVSGSSSVINESYVTYSNEAKVRILGVNSDTIKKYTVFSKEVAYEMAKGLFNKIRTSIAVSVTGEAESDKKVCTCYYTIISCNKEFIGEVSFNGNRNEVRRLQTNHILTKIIEFLS